MLRATCRDLALVTSLLVSSAGCADSPPETTGRLIVDDVATVDETSGENWLAYGRTSSELRFSPLTQINDSNVGDLSPDWVLELPEDRGLASTPLVVDGVMYFIGSMNIVRAVDATSGELMWEYDPQVRDYVERLRAGWDHSRGIAYWNDKVYVATWDGRLNAVDAATGREIWSASTPSSPCTSRELRRSSRGRCL